MADKHKQIDKVYTLSDDSVNVYGFRLLTEGYQLAEFDRNPIGYYMHKRDDGVVVRWSDLKVDGNKITGKPVINLSNARGQQTVDEIESQFLNAASVGKIVVLEMSDDPALMLPGQTMPTVTKWFNRECSLVDLPGNYNGLTELCDADGHAILLADFTLKTKTHMQIVKLTAAQLALVNLTDTADEALVTATLTNLVDKAKLVDTANAAKQVAETALADFKAASDKQRVASILTKALDDKKVTAALQATLLADYATNPNGLQALVDALPAYQSVAAALVPGAGEAGGASWNDLDRAGKLEDLKASDPAGFAAKYKAQFGRDYK